MGGITFWAVENHAAMVVTGASTVSAIIDPYGRQVALEYNQEDKQTKKAWTGNQKELHF